MVIDVENDGRLSYLAYSGKTGAPVKGGNKPPQDVGKKNTPKPSNEPSLADVPAGYRDPLPFAFQQGDTVAILGNGLPDRMQHDGWMETLLQSELKGKQVRFRNMSASGDRPDSFPRSSGAT
ncbi:MAG: membrane-bound dehydrogenase domain-containing protein, partial [Planctomycetota bacterium]